MWESMHPVYRTLNSFRGQSLSPPPTPGYLLPASKDSSSSLYYPVSYHNISFKYVIEIFT